MIPQIVVTETSNNTTTLNDSSSGSSANSETLLPLDPQAHGLPPSSSPPPTSAPALLLPLSEVTSAPPLPPPPLPPIAPIPTPVKLHHKHCCDHHPKLTLSIDLNTHDAACCSPHRTHSEEAHLEEGRQPAPAPPPEIGEEVAQLRSQEASTPNLAPAPPAPPLRPNHIPQRADSPEATVGCRRFQPHVVVVRWTANIVRRLAARMIDPPSAIEQAHQLDHALAHARTQSVVSMDAEGKVLRAHHDSKHRPPSTQPHHHIQPSHHQHPQQHGGRGMHAFAEDLRAKSKRPWAWSLWFLIPILFITPISLMILLFGVVPLGDPNGGVLDKLVWLLVVNPIAYAIFNSLVTLIFYAILDEHIPVRPLRYYIPLIIGTYVVEVAVMGALYLFLDTFSLMGLIPFFLAVFFVYSGLKGMRAVMWHQGCTYYKDRLKQYRKVIFVITIYVIILACWVIAYRELGRQGRAILPFVLLVIVFFFKKILLSVTDSFPITIAMLIAGLWLENLDDVFQTIVFPVVPDSDVFLFFLLWLRKTAENVAYILFLTRGWFRFRVWIKAFLKRLFCPRKVTHADTKIIREDVNADDRGHGNQRPGYWRRQIMFISLKFFSQVHSNLHYLTLSPVLRHGVNRRFYPVNEAAKSDHAFPPGQYRNSILFAVTNLFTTAVIGVILLVLFAHYRRHAMAALRRTYESLLTTPVYMGFVIAILCSSSILSTLVVQYHNRIWFYSEGGPDA